MMAGSAERLIIGITGASGAIYAVRLVKACLELGLQLDLVVSDYGKRLLIEECDLNLKVETFGAYLDRRYGVVDRPGTLTVHGAYDLGSGIASGSQRWRGMVVAPCSMKTLSAIAHGASADLIQRAADVTLKEERKLVLVPRETPLNRIQLRNLSAAAEAGASILPAMPAFYYQPKSFDDLADFIVGRILALLGLSHELFEPWQG